MTVAELCDGDLVRLHVMQVKPRVWFGYEVGLGVCHEN